MLSFEDNPLRLGEVMELQISSDVSDIDESMHESENAHGCQSKVIRHFVVVNKTLKPKLKQTALIKSFQRVIRRGLVLL